VKPSRIHRLLKLITMLQTGNRYSSRDLMRELKVGRRTLYRDFSMLKLAGVPLLYEAAHRGYTIEKSFFLPPVNFTFPEALALMMLAEKYRSHAGMPNPDAALTATMKIESTLPAEIRDHCGSALDTIEFRPTPATDASSTTQLFELLWQATRERRTLAVTYDSYYERGEIQTQIDPYRLMFITRAWYVIGYSRKHRQVRTFKVDRIIQATATRRRFRVDPKFDPANYFGNAWQMIRGDKRYHVRIRFSLKVAGNVEEVLWHPTQQTHCLDDGSLLYEVDVDGVDEIAWWVLGYGREAVVEKPAELRRIIAQHIHSMAQQYQVQ